MTTLQDRCREFRRLHESGCFVLPNPWDPGSARVLEQLGFPALATTSAGFAWSQGLTDGRATLGQILGHFRSIAESVDVPINADFEGGYAIEPAAVGVHVAAAAETGIAGLSIEDSTGDPSNPLFDFTLAVDRIRASRKALDESGAGVLLTARTEGFISGRPDLEETIRRLVAFAEAGADCLYAPGIHTVEQIAAVVRAVAPKPVNVLVPGSSFTVAQLADLGVRRISLGSALASAAMTGFVRAAREIAESGTFSSRGESMSFSEVNGLFAKRDSTTE